MRMFCVLLFGCVVLSATHAKAGLMISQYYEGTSFNKWIELHNSGVDDVVLSDYSIGRWSNASREDWKTGAAASASSALTGTLAAGETYLMSHASAAAPGYATADVMNSSIINFNGDDSVVLYLSGSFMTSSIVDAVSFSGNQGQDKSFVRRSLGQGYDLTAGTNVTDFSSVWEVASLADVDNAAEGTNPRLGFSSFTAVPEPASMTLWAIGCMAMVAVRRRRSPRLLP